MSHKHIRYDVVRKALLRRPAEFYTKELSTDQAMIEGHPSLISHSQYHSFVGKFLSQCCRGEVTKIPYARDSELGEKWRNNLHGKAVSSSSALAASLPPTQSAGPRSAVSELQGIGPQSPSDKAFTARMRFHQSWYRAAVLDVPFGTGPEPTSTSHYGNMLRREDAERGLNFLHPDIHDAALARIREGARNVEPFRLLHNMLSSQPMCFNLFGLFVKRPALATQLLRTMPELELDEVLDVKLEYAPQPKSDYLDDGTSFDAFIDYRRTDGARALLGIETKLTDSFSNGEDRPAYHRWMGSPGSPWTEEGAQHVAHIRPNQLWRDHLLAIAMRDRTGSPYAHATFMLVRHPRDREGVRIVDGYRALLKPEDRSFIDMPIDVLVERWKRAVDSEHRAWLDSFHTRYLDFEQSDSAWRHRHA